MTRATGQGPSSAGSASRLTLLPERTRLPRGRSALPGGQVASSQRGRILQATVEEVAERGYEACTVQDVVRRARVSRSAFYESFTDKQDAFAVAHLVASEQLFDHIARAVSQSSDEGWRSRHRAAVAAYLEGFSSAPAYAVSFMVELRAAGPRLLDQRDQVLERHARGLAALADEARRERGTGRRRLRPSDPVVLGATGAADELATREIRAGRTARLSRLVDPIVAIQRAVIDGVAVEED